MSEIIEGSVKVIVDACFKAGYEKGYQQGRADKYQEITSEYMLLTEKQVAEIRACEREEIEELMLSRYNSLNSRGKHYVEEFMEYVFKQLNEQD